MFGALVPLELESSARPPQCHPETTRARSPPTLLSPQSHRLDDLGWPQRGPHGLLTGSFSGGILQSSTCRNAGPHPLGLPSCTLLLYYPLMSSLSCSRPPSGWGQKTRHFPK